MFRKILFLSIISALAIGVTSFTYVNNQPKPTKKTVKKTKAKKSTQPESSSTQSANEAKITWYNMSDGYAKAKKEKKVLVVDVYTNWCTWCKVMDKWTYDNHGISKKMNEYAVAVKFNPEVNGNHNVNGQVLSSDQLALYLNKGSRIPGYPHTFMWKDLSDNNKIDSYSGYVDSTVFNVYLNKMIQQ
ncbi:MAG: DUF255 domain-containing protein [Bacteroidia bacterium]|nr:DUF255 domain-containing protein [Bacteroidia bacterium]